MSARLADLGRHRRANKFSHAHYAALYERYLAGRAVRSVLELGVADGCSLLMWLDYFPAATVVGVDVNRLERPEVSDHPRCRLLQLDQADRCLPAYGPFDLIVDDAGHVPAKQRQSLELLWPALSPGGLYVVEDLETSYWPEHQATSALVPYLQGVVEGMTAYYANQAAPGQYPLPERVTAVHHHHNIVFIEKA